MSATPDETTWIRKASWVVAFDAIARRHVYLRDADVVFAGGRFTHVGPAYPGVAGRILDGTDRLVMPGLVNVHGHLGTEPLGKGFFEDLGNPKQHGSRLYEYIYAVRPPDDRTRRAATRVSVAELMLSGCTTVADMSIPYEGWQETFAGTGIRAWLAPMFKSASWVMRNDHRLEYAWDEAAGERDFRRAIEVVEAARRDPSGRLSGIVMPAQSDTCTPELMQEAHREAERLDLPFQIHSGQSVPEFHEMMNRHGMTSTAFMAELGILGPRTCVAHSIFIDSHPWLQWPHHADLGILAATGASVVHCPVTFAYRGARLHDFGSYLRAGVTMAMGTDTHPHDMANEMQIALLGAKTAGRFDGTRTEDVFHAATIGGARVLGRDDLGRIAVGACADLSIFDLAHPTMRPCRDPLRSFLHAGGSAAISDVFVDGRQVVADRRHQTIDLERSLDELDEGHSGAMDSVSGRDWAGRTAAEMSPLSLLIARSVQPVSDERDAASSVARSPRG